MLQVACRESGVASLLECIGAAFVNWDRKQQQDDGDDDDPVDDILTIGRDKDPLLPNDFVLRYVHEVVAGMLYKEYRTIVASDVAFSYPEAKELARTVANRLESPRKYNNNFNIGGSNNSDQNRSNPDNQRVMPRFVHICPEHRKDIPYLHNLLEKGYKMTADMGYLKMEMLKFNFQKLTAEQAMGDDENVALDKLDLKLLEIKENTKV